MKPSKKLTLAPILAISGFALVAGALTLRGKGSSPSASVATVAGDEAGSAVSAPAPMSSALQPMTAARGPASVQPKAPEPSSPAEPAAPQAKTEFKYAERLQSYQKLKAKVFMSDEEKETRAQMLADREFLHSLEPLLMKPARLGTEAQSQQNAAIDCLLEAVANPSGGAAAAEVLRTVVQDTQLENPTVDMETRKGLAEIKADVLYHWSAQDPDRAGDLANWLPGPVSQKIWQNVLAAQRSNLMESAGR